MELEIEVGKTYRDRKGRLWKINGTDGRLPWPISGGRWTRNGRDYEGKVWRRDGRAYVNGHYRDEPDDLLAEA